MHLRYQIAAFRDHAQASQNKQSGLFEGMARLRQQFPKHTYLTLKFISRLIKSEYAIALEAAQAHTPQRLGSQGVPH